MIWISDDAVDSILSWDSVPEIARLIENGLAEVALGALVEAPVTRLDAPEHRANYTVFPAYSRLRDLATVKVLSGVEANPERGLPMIDALIVAMDARSGAMRAIMDGRHITAMRTAVTTAVALRKLVPETARSLGIIGAGLQGLSHAVAFSALMPNLDLSIASASNSTERANDIADKASSILNRPIRAVSCQEIEQQADTIVVASVSNDPLIGMDARPDAVIASVGHFVPGSTEIDPALVAQAAIIVSDHPERLLRHWQAHAPALGDALERIISFEALIAQPCPKRSGRSVFLSDGRSFEDCVVAHYVLQEAERRGLGQLLNHR